MSKKPLPNMEKYSKKFGKHDLDRIGLFIEMPYLTKLKGIRIKKESPEEYFKRMLAGGPKTKCGLTDVYFDKSFKRIFVGEAIKGKRKEKKPKPIDIPFRPTGPGKAICTPGDYTGTFGGFVKEFSPKCRPKPKFKSSKPNIVTSPGKKGGPGYVNITIGKYPEYKSQRCTKAKGKQEEKSRPPMIIGSHPAPYFELNPYRDLKHDVPTKPIYIRPIEKPLDEKLAGRPAFVPTGPTKWTGGCKAGTFSKYPEWKHDELLTPAQQAEILAMKAHMKTEIEGIFIPPTTVYKTMFNTPVLHATSYQVNATNFRVYKPKYVSRLLDNVY